MSTLADVELINTTREEATLALAKYRVAVKTCGAHPFQAEDAAIMKAYRALAKGGPILDLHQAIVVGGVHENGLPKFAVCRADAQECWVELNENGSVAYRMRQWLTGHQRSFRTNPRFPADTLSRYNWSDRRNAKLPTSGRAVVPLVPAPLRPPHALSGYLTLWEVEQWTPAPPRDPFLLKWLGSGYLCAVIAMWNLTPLERAVMRSSIVR